ncbi:MAG: ferrochelatase, partial [Acidimicrobiales bacterium]
MSRRVGVLLMAYGTPRSKNEIEAYYTDIRRGRPPTADALAELTDRYAAIGGLSPLAELTESQRDVLQDALDEADPDRYDVMIGLKHADPRIEATAGELASNRCSTIVGLVLAPHFSASSIGQYLHRARRGVASKGPNTTFVGIESWATEPAFVEFLAADLKPRIEAMAATTAMAVRVLFTAHSLPTRI